MNMRLTSNISLSSGSLLLSQIQQREKKPTERNLLIISEKIQRETISKGYHRYSDGHHYALIGFMNSRCKEGERERDGHSRKKKTTSTKAWLINRR